MLKDAGMVGRFSESRAKEIKEMRELQADLEAVQEGDQSWGLTSGRRSRGAAVKKSMKLPSDSDDDEDEEDEGAPKKKVTRAASGDGSDSEDPQEKIRRARAKAGIVFDESDSD